MDTTLKAGVEHLLKRRSMYKIRGRTLDCPYCGNNTFFMAGEEFKNLGNALNCCDCGFIQLHADLPVQIANPSN